MKHCKYLPIVLLMCVGFGFATTDAQQGSAIFGQSCFIPPDFLLPYYVPGEGWEKSVP